MSKYSKGKHSKKKNICMQIISNIFLLLIISSLSYHLYKSYISNKNDKIYDQINKIDAPVEQEVKPINVQKVEKLNKENSDVIGWIQIENSLINYPILQTTNNEYYLTHTYQKEESKYGSIFLKAQCNVLDNNSNLIIYGHNMGDSQMFHDLLNYTDYNYYEGHKTIQISTLDEERKYDIIAVFKSRVFYEDEKDVFRYYNYTNFKNEQEYNEFIKKCKEIELYDTETTAKYGEQLITLITCEYSQENGRLVVVAKIK